MTKHRCASTLELLAARDGEASPSLGAHIETCPRCQAALEAVAGIDHVEAPDVLTLTFAGRPTVEKPDQARSGQLWIVAAEAGSDETEVVAVVGRVQGPDGQDAIVVAPTSSALNEAADGDLVIEESPLGYPHLVCVWAQGVVGEDQLLECAGRLERVQRADLVASYQWLTGTSAKPELQTRTGSPLAGEQDGRLVFRSLFADRLRPLWRAVDEAWEAPAEEPLEDESTLAAVIRAAISGGAWDEQTLLEQTRVDGAVLKAMQGDQLDLTHASDVESVAAVVRALELSDPIPVVRASLERSTGGEPQDSDQDMPLAARSRADVPQRKRTTDLYLGQDRVDDSPEGRARAIDHYLTLLSNELD